MFIKYFSQTTTTSAPVPTTVRPAPGKPEIGKYTLNDANQTCILAEFAAQLNFSYSIGMSHQIVSKCLNVINTADTK